MSTRSKRQSNTTPATKDSAASPSPSPKKRGAKDGDGASASADQNASKAGRQARAKAKSKSSGGGGRAGKKYCLCKGDDDGRPMVLCTECDDWYHFECIDLTEREAEDIHTYICPPCTEKTGLRSVMTWEGPEALEEVYPIPPSSAPATASAKSRTKSSSASAKPKQHSETPKPNIETPLLPRPESSASEDDSADEDYVADSAKAKAGKRRAHLPSDSSSSEAEVESKAGPRRLKRKSVDHPRPQPPPKKTKKAGAKAEDQPQDDPLRKFCREHFRTIFHDIFLRYPHVSATVDGAEVKTEKTPQELTDQEKDEVIVRANQFAVELERHVYEAYAEHDKTGNLHAGNEYRGRLRTLQYNLPKLDRVNLHKRIASGAISPEAMARMSSTELASEEAQESIKAAEREALAHSILVKTTAPRAKLTHKGLQDIEDISGENQAREQEEFEDRIEQERFERMRVAQEQRQRQRTHSISVPPESPVTPASSTGVFGQAAPLGWGNPPPISPHANPVAEAVGATSAFAPSFPSPFATNAGDIPMSAEPELNLTDFINLDYEPSGPTVPGASGSHNTTASSTEAGTANTILSPTSTQPQPTSPETVSAGAGASSSASVLSPTTPSEPAPPTAAAVPEPEPKPTPSFDLSSLWSSSAPEPQAAASPKEQQVGSPMSMSDDQSTKDPAEGKEGSGMGMSNEQELMSEAHDQDFDMFLSEDREQEPPRMLSPAALEEQFKAAPIVWTGNIHMPADPQPPHEASVVARQIGGKTLPPDSLLWRTLFPRNPLRVEGRVATKEASNFLAQMRMNASKELYAVAFTPAPGMSGSVFNSMNEFLLNKDRFGLIFPWGGKAQDPGREFYIAPLQSSKPLPEYVELLDELKLPKIRSSDYLIGVWVLNRGKLGSPMPLPTPGPAPSAIAPTPAPGTKLPPIDFSQLQGVIATLQSQVGPTSAFDLRKIAGELQTLTPEQAASVQNVLQQLHPSTLGLAPQVPQRQVVSPPVGFVPQAPMPTTWGSPTLAPPPPMGQPPFSYSPPPLAGYGGTPSYNSSPAGDYYRRDSYPPHPDRRDSYDRGPRGRDHDRGRGRVRGVGGTRGRGRGRGSGSGGGPDGSAGPGRGRKARGGYHNGAPPQRKNW